MSGANPYQNGRTRFMEVDVLIAPGTLVPRSETELLGRTALGLLHRMQPSADLRVIDMCCGSGNLACGIAKNHPAARVWASDLTDGAVALARTNVEHLGLGDRVTVVQGDLFAPLSEMGLEAAVDMIVCNPPYISSHKLATERAELLNYEPREAFDGGPYGVSIFQRVIRDAVAYLKTGGMLLFEIGLGQQRQVAALFDRAKSYEPVAAISNAAHQPRVIVATKGRTASAT